MQPKTNDMTRMSGLHARLFVQFAQSIGSCLENELRGLLKIFGIRLASKVPHGAYDVVVRQHIEPDPLLARALLPLLEARQMLYRTYLKLDNEVKAIVRT